MEEITNQSCLLMNVSELGHKLRLSRRQIFRLKASGKLPAPVRIGCAVRWRADEINAWLSAGAPNRQTWEKIRKTGR